MRPSTSVRRHDTGESTCERRPRRAPRVEPARSVVRHRRAGATRRRRPTRVVVVEGHPIFRDGLIQCLSSEHDFRVVGQWDTGLIDVLALGKLSPDLVLMDVELPGRSGIDAARAIHAALPHLGIVMLTAFADRELLLDAIDAGAAGYLLKHTSPGHLVATLRRIAQGEQMLTPSSAASVLSEFQLRQSSVSRIRLPHLTPREEDILRLLATGESNRQIAQRLSVSGQTIKSHLASIFRKLGVSDRTRAAIRAFKAGLVES